MDGYSLEEICELHDLNTILIGQLKIRQRLREIDIEIGFMPKPPTSDSWVTSIPDMGVPKDDRFKLSDFKKIGKLRREYRQLKLEETKSISNLKLKEIDILMARISEIEKV